MHVLRCIFNPHGIRKDDANSPCMLGIIDVYLPTRIFQVCKFCAFAPKKPYQKAEILHLLEDPGT